ncbi:hypothetical protein WAB17_12230 [Parerythrobacter aurantius]|uniref:hypothetical protein n=1 Tax=Parerythrobacter aurantius TaxID=3127706 RepID=UPI00324D7839
MCRIAYISAALALAGATDLENGTVVAPSFDNPAYVTPNGPWKEVPATDFDEAKKCADTIREARDSAGLPALDRRTAAPDKPELIWAVDHRRDGCGVLVMRGDPQDIRPIPEPADDATIIPAGSGEQY